MTFQNYKNFENRLLQNLNKKFNNSNNNSFWQYLKLKLPVPTVAVKLEGDSICLIKSMVSRFSTIIF